MEFDYQFLDGLMSLAPIDIGTALATRCPTGAQHLGPLIEYAYLRHQNTRQHLPSPTSLIDSCMTRTIESCVGQRAASMTTTSLDPYETEIAPLPVRIAGNGIWSAFIRRLVNAAKRAGFDDLSAKGIGAALSEMADNAIDHSERANAATVAYRWLSGEFEMVIADPGIGIRASLRKNAKHAWMADDQTALEQATTMGVTRYPDGSGHGTGFKTVFDAIAAFSGVLRFRSGTGALILDGTKMGSVGRKSRQRIHFQGFLGAIFCRSPGA